MRNLLWFLGSFLFSGALVVGCSSMPSSDEKLSDSRIQNRRDADWRYQEMRHQEWIKCLKSQRLNDDDFFKGQC